MGLHDREWYQKAVDEKAGRPTSFDSKMRASAKNHDIGRLLRGEPRKSDDFPIKTILATIAALALLAVVLKYFFTR